jgi:SAM-dependent methyltransferase
MGDEQVGLRGAQSLARRSGRGILNSETLDAIRRRYIEHNMAAPDGAMQFPFADVVGAMEPGCVLDLAAMDGALGISMATVGWTYEGIDLIDTAARLAQLRAKQAGLDQVMSVKSANWLTYEPMRDAYDLALDLGSLHAFPAAYHEAYLSKLYRLMRPGARLIMYVRFDGSDDPSTVRYTTPALLYAALTPRFTILERLATTATLGMRTIPAVWLLLQA